MQAQDKPSSGKPGGRGMSLPPPSRPPPSIPPPSRPPLSIAPPSRPPAAAHRSAAGPLHEIAAGGASGLLLVIHGLAFAALVFTGKLGPHLPAGIGAFLIGSAALALVVALRSSFRPAVAAPQDTTSALLALVGASVAAGASAEEDILPTALAAFTLTTLAIGAIFTALGALGLGKIIRFVPYPVIGGFLAGTGWLLVLGGMTVLTGSEPHYGTLGALFAPGALLRWIPGLAFGLLLVVLSRKVKSPFVVPALIVLGPVLFYASLGASGHSVEDASAANLLLGPFSQGKLWPALGAADLRHVEWSLLGHNAGIAVALVVLASISMPLRTSGLELVAEHEIDLDRELGAAGLGNLLAGALGAPVGYLALGESTLAFKLGARGRVPGVIAAALCVLCLALGAPIFAFVPRAALGGVLFFLGLSVLLDAIYASFFRLPRAEYALVLLILLAVVTVGFLEGVGLGIVISAVLFALNYARINVVKHVISGAVLRSKAARPATSEALLHHLGAQIHVLKLQGYLFFGTAYNLLTRVQARMAGGEPMPVRYIVLDFRHVDGIDSSAVLSFAKMRKLAEAQKITLAFTDLPRGVRRQLERGGCVDPKVVPEGVKPGSEVPVLVFPDLDHGLEWCEDRILSENADSRPSTDALEREIAGMSRHRELVAELSRYLERVDADAGFELFKQGESSNDLYLIESGEVAAWLTLDGKREKRLRTMGPGSVVGEAALYLGAPRSASVRASRPSVLYRMREGALERMTEEAPHLAATFHHFVAQLLAERVVNTTTEAQMVFY
ncbi:MAG: SulP family inorganic anion transporter [Byssovorax sp.]